MQGNYWGNHAGGESLALMLQGRLASSPRVTTDPSQAHLKFIPLHTRNVCSRHYITGKRNVTAFYETCGLQYEGRNALPDLWHWLLKQPSFAESDGSDHFIVIEPPLNHLDIDVRRALCLLLV